jgi:hypothetical protein
MEKRSPPGPGVEEEEEDVSDDDVMEVGIEVETEVETAVGWTRRKLRMTCERCRRRCGCATCAAMISATAAGGVQVTCASL